MITPEERYVLACLLHGRRLRLDGAGYAVVDMAGFCYRVHQDLVKRLLALRLVESSPESGGCPELTSQGRQLVLEGPLPR